MDIKYKYDIADMVKFCLTAFNSPKVYTGVVCERWSGDKTKIYRVNCLEKGMIPYTVSEPLILEKIA